LAPPQARQLPEARLGHNIGDEGSTMANTDIPASRHTLGGAIGRLSGQWGYFVGLGVLAVFLGLLAMVLVVSATIASIFVLGAFMVLTGVIEIAMGFRARTWGRFFLWVLAGAVYVVAGALAFAQPLMAAAVFTLLLGAGLVATGLLRLWVGFELPPGQPSGMVMFSGAVTTALGILIVIGWPANSLYVLGLMLGVDLIFNGWGWIGLGLFLRRHRHAV
jgi:uncharacterized membrane protein HdeD (DUF308 family)